MIKFIRGNILESNAYAIVNPVNTVGVMGKGLALQFKQSFPDMFRDYKAACDRGDVQIGSMHIYDLGEARTPRYIVNFPTKQNWRDKSSLLNWIERGLCDLVKQVNHLGIRSIAIPALGCGLGGLNWLNVKPMIVDAFQKLDDVTVYVYEP